MKKSGGKAPAGKPRAAGGNCNVGQGEKIALVSLGCPKNLVDLQIISAALARAGFDVGVQQDEADAILVNTCAFIEDARREAIGAIAEACAAKADPALPCRAVIVSGCLPQRYRDAVFQACPDVDATLGVDDLERAPETVRVVLDRAGRGNDAAEADGTPSGAPVPCVSPGLSKALFDPVDPAFTLTPGPFAYVKIAEGCRHACAFCAIPGIRGRLRSRSVENIVAEVRALLKAGKREIDLVAQDVTSYGADFARGGRLVELLGTLEALPGEFRVRLLYGHPAHCTDELLDFIAGSEKILPYFDIPVQHASAAVLRRMGRADTVSAVPAMAERIRSRVPGAVLRTTCLVGFPGETAADFAELLSFVREAHFDHLGAFVFSPEEGTRAFSMDAQVPGRTARDRRRRLMRAQAEIVREKLDSLKGSEVEVLMETPPSRRSGPWIGRAERQAPDGIDGVTYVEKAPAKTAVGSFVRCRVTGHTDYDLVAEAIAPST